MINHEYFKDILNKREMLNDLKKVKKFLDRYPLSSILEVNEKTGVSIGEILNFIKNGFIKIKQFDKTFLSKKY